MAAIFELRTSVQENHMSLDELTLLGITPENLLTDIAAGELACWVMDLAGEIVGFSMADNRDQQIFALFVRPGHEGKGYGRKLLAQALAWLGDKGHSEAWLSTGIGTRADAFYADRGWHKEKIDNGEQYYRIRLPK